MTASELNEQGNIKLEGCKEEGHELSDRVGAPLICEEWGICSWCFSCGGFIEASEPLRPQQVCHRKSIKDKILKMYYIRNQCF